MTNTLASLAQGRDNNFNVLRMAAATLVVYAHSVTLNNGLVPDLDSHLRPNWSGDWVHALTGVDAGTLGVRIFFVISGFLLARSLSHDRSLPKFFVNRSLRLLPALAVSLIVTALVIAPVFTTLPAGDYLARSQVWNYIGSNLVFWCTTRLPGVFETNPYAGVVNGSLWTLAWEVLMYFTLAALCITTVLRRRQLMLAWIAGCILANTILFKLHLAHHRQLWIYADFAALFFSGVLMWTLADRLRIDGAWTLIIAVLVAFLMIAQRWWAPFQVLTAPLLAYLVVAIAYLPSRVLNAYRRVGDYSYGTYLYAFPIQQAMVAGLPKMSYAPFFFLSLTLALIPAIASWHWIEKPALALKRGHRVKAISSDPEDRSAAPV